MQECEKEGGRKSLANSGTYPQQIVTTSHPHLITPSPPHTLTPSASQPLTYTMYLSHHHSTTSHHHTLTTSPPHIHSLTPSPPSSPRHLYNLTRTQCTSPTITPQPPTPHTITSHPLTPPSSMHTLALHARPRTTPLPQQVQEGVDRTELRHMPSGGIAARSLDRVPAPRTNSHHHQHAQRHGDHRARAWL